eukprot:m.12106 g.12106  ORF g.12106 m.12106 type:complete len:501 (-) comp4585_c0_seq1:80-1582(-)
MALETGKTGPTLLKVLGGHHRENLSAMLYFGKSDGSEHAMLTAGEDRSMLLWLMRDNGEYWPSVHKELGSPGTVLNYIEANNRIAVGMVNGVITVYNLSEDWNGVSLQKSFKAHDGRVADMVTDTELGIILTCGRDKKVAIFSSDTGASLASHSISGAGTQIQYSPAAKICFVGDSGGNIHMLKIVDKSSFKEIAVLQGHRGGITAMLWEPSTEHLFSAGQDKLVIAWDIGAAKGERFEMRGMRNKVKALGFDKHSDQLLVSDEKFIFCWDMTKGRKPNPIWKESDECQLCKAAFLWNVSKMWDEKKVEMNRQHHCRACGKAICEACSKDRTLLATMGHETKVRVCSVCIKKVTDAERCRRAKAIECYSKAHICDFYMTGSKPMYVIATPDHSVKMYSIQAEVLDAKGMNIEQYREKTSIAAQATSVFGNMSLSSLMGGNKDDDDEDIHATEESPQGKPLVYKLGGDDDEEDKKPVTSLYMSTEQEDPDDPDADYSSPFQ